MNRIAISLKTGETVRLLDDEDVPKDEILQRLSSLYSINNIAIIKTNTTSVIIRPSNIASIVVEEVSIETDKKELDDAVEPPPEEKSEEHIDIITDAD